MRGIRFALRSRAESELGIETFRAADFGREQFAGEQIPILSELDPVFHAPSSLLGIDGMLRPDFAWLLPGFCLAL